MKEGVFIYPQLCEKPLLVAKQLRLFTIFFFLLASVTAAVWLADVRPPQNSNKR